MTRFGGIPTPLFISALAFSLGATACGGGEGLTEALIEQQLESEGVEGVDVDLDSGEFRVETEDGTFELDADGEGGFTLETEDGTFVQGADAELPDDFPDEVLLPDGEIVGSFSDGQNVAVSIESGRPIEDLGRAWQAAMEAAGYEVLLESYSDGLATVQVENSSWRVAFTGGEDGSTSFVQLSVAPVSG